MRIALTYNLRLHSREESEAELDSADTVAAVVSALTRLGHEVDRVEASGPAARAVARLEASFPELVVNMASGRRGKFREAFYPALLDELGLPYTGSDAYACTVSLDKSLTKEKLERAGVPVARGIFHDGSSELDASGLRFPVIVKPNFEGSSIGIGPDSVVAKLSDLAPRVQASLEKFPDGVLIEEFIAGRDVVVGLLARPKGKGVLPPGEYVFDPKTTGDRPFAFYDFQLRESGDVLVRAPAELDGAVRERIVSLSEKAFHALDIADHGLIDFRVTDAGELFFLEVDPLPSFSETATFMALARAGGVDTIDGVLEAIIANASARHRIGKTPRAKRSGLRVGLTFNLKRIKPGHGGTADDEAEYDSETTIRAIHDAIASHGHEVVDLEATPELASTIAAANVDVVFNVAEGMRGRNRESQIPAILELLGIPYTGSDPATLSLALDKVLAKRICREAGIPTPEFLVMTSGREKLPKSFTFPLIVKPIAEGSSKGVLGTSVAENEPHLRELATAMAARYKQGALVEAYLPGREFTVALLGGEKKPRVLPPMEIVFTRRDVKHPVYNFDHKLEPNEEIKYEAPAKIDPEVQREIEGVARASFVALGCRDVARVDIRLDARGRAHFIECNPLPGLTPGWSDICLIAESVGMDYRALIGEILAPAIKRFRTKQP
jgi:D-alanine-D-alanine ligase